MMDLLAAGGLVLVIEGFLWAAAPRLGLHLLVVAAQTPEAKLRMAGAATMAVGVALVWIVRG